MRIVLVALAFGFWCTALLRAQASFSPVRATRCPSAGTAGFPFGSRDSLRRAWYGGQFRALGETGLCSELGGARQLLRFVWIPSFHPSVAVVVRDEGGKYVLRGKKLSGAGGYEPGRLVADTTFVLSRAEWDTLAGILAESGFLSDSGVPTTPLGYDGAQWILEWAGDGRHYVVDRWTPYPTGPARPFRRVGEWLLRRSGLVAESLVVEY